MASLFLQDQASMRAVRNKAGLGRRPLATALAALAWAGPAAAQEPTPPPAYAPCLVAHDSAGDYLQAFLAKGWTSVDGAARGAAMRGLAEVTFLRRRDGGYGEGLSPEELARGLSSVQAAVADAYEDAAVLGKDGAVMVVQAPFPETSALGVHCVLTGPDLPDIDALFASCDVWRLTDTLTYTVAEPQQVARASGRLLVEAMRHAPDAAPGVPLAGLEAIIVSWSSTSSLF